MKKLFVRALFVIFIVLTTNANAVVSYNKWTMVRMRDSAEPNYAVSFFQKNRSKPYVFIMIYKANREEKAYFGKGVDDYIVVIGGKNYFGGPDFNIQKGSLVIMKVDHGSSDAFINNHSGAWATFSLGDSVIAEFKKGNKLKLAIQTKNGKIISEISLIGFTKKFDEMKQKASKNSTGGKLTEKEIEKGLDARLLDADKIFEKDFKQLLFKVSVESMKIIGPEKAEQSIEYVKQINSDSVVSQAMKKYEDEISDLAIRYVDYVGYKSSKRKKYYDGIIELLKIKSIKIIEDTKQKTIRDNRK